MLKAKVFFTLLAVLLVPTWLRAQTHTFPAEDTNNTFTGTNTFNNRLFTSLTQYTVATLPVPASSMSGLLAIVTDGTSGSDCTVGGGTSAALCRNSGAAWISLGGSGGGGGGVSSFNTRTGAVVPATNDYNFNQLAGSLLCSQTPAYTGAVTKPAGSCVTSTSPFGPNVIDPLVFGVKMDAKVCISLASTIAITSGSKTVSCSTGNFTSADIGKDIFATNACCLEQQSFLGAVVLARTTIASITNSATVVVTGSAATQSCTSDCELVWGTNDDTGWSAADTALTSLVNQCGTLLVPSGYSMIREPHFNTPNATCVGNTSIVGPLDYSQTFLGSGPGTSVFVIEPDLDWTACTLGVSAGTLNGCYLAQSQVIVRELSFMGAGANVTDPGSPKCVLNVGGGSQIWDVGLSGFAANTPNTTGFCGHSGVRSWGLACDGFGQMCGTFDDSQNSGAVNVCFYCFWGDSSQNLNVGGVKWVDYAGEIGSAYCTNSCANTFYNATFTYLNGTHTQQNSGYFSADGTDAIVVAGGIVRMDGNNWDNSSCGAGIGHCNGLLLESGQVFARNTLFNGFGSSGGAVNEFSCTTCQLYLDSSDQLETTGPAFNNFVPGSIVATKSVAGSCTGTATSSTTLGLYGTGPNVSATACTSTTIGSGATMDHSGSMQYLQVLASHVGVSSSSGVVTVLKNGSTTTITCTVGTGTSCGDTTHTVSFVAGDLISIQFTTQGSEVLAGVKAAVGID